jgi:hypothetical protein
MRLSIEGILWILRTGAPWRDLPEVFGKWKSVYDRFRSWTDSGVWASIWNALSSANRDHAAVMIDSTACGSTPTEPIPPVARPPRRWRVPAPACLTKIHLACDALGYPLSFILTGTTRTHAWISTRVLSVRVVS